MDQDTVAIDENGMSEVFTDIALANLYNELKALHDMTTFGLSHTQKTDSPMPLKAQIRICTFTTDMFKTNAFTSFVGPVTMATRYAELGATKNVMKLVELSNATFGKLSKRMLIEYYGMKRSTKTCNDARYDNYNFKIKSSRLWGMKFKWEHIMPTYSVDYLLLLALYPKRAKVFLLKKSALIDIHNEFDNAFNQGPNGNQGLWFCNTEKRLSPHLIEVIGTDLDTAIKKSQLAYDKYKKTVS